MTFRRSTGAGKGRPGRRRGPTLAAICAFWTVVFVLLSGPVALAPLELRELAWQDTLVRHGLKTPAPDNLVFVAVDEASLDLSQLEPEEIAASPALTMMSEDFPWSRAVYAETIERLIEAGAAVVVLDVHLPRPGRGDDVLRDTLQRHGNRAVIASLYEDTAGEGGRMTTHFIPPTPGVLPADTSGQTVAAFANFWPEADRIVRAAHHRMSDAQLLGAAEPDGTANHSLAALALHKTGHDGSFPPAGLIRFCEPGSFPTIPLWSLFVPEVWESNLDDGAIFRGKIVMVGPLASRFRDVFRTPVGTLPGPEIHLHSIAAAQAGAFYRRASTGAVMATCVLMGLIAFGVSRFLRRPLVALAVLGLLLAGYFALGLLLYNFADFIPGLLYPTGTLVLAGLTCFAYDFSLERRERARVRRSLERYVSRDVVRDLLDRGNEVLDQLGGTRKDVSILFSDLRGFTALSEKADPAHIVASLNEYLAEMVRIVFHNHGTLDKFIGDSVMAVWGTVNSAGVRGDAERAVRTAAEMLEAVARMRRDWTARGTPDLHLGIGICSGPAIFGNIGSELKMEPTVIGDTVNLASRLESVTKQYGVPLVLGDSVVRAATGSFAFRTLDTIRVVGRTEPVTIHSLAFDDADRAIDPPWLPLNEEAWTLYRIRRFAEAGALFARALEAVPGDACLAAMVRKCRTLAADPPPDDWEPVTNLTGK